MKKILSALVMVSASLGVSAAELPKTHFQVVGGGSHNYTFGAVEKPFWEKTLPEASGGRVTADLAGLAESGLKGPEVVRLMRSGAIDIGMGVFAYVSSDDAMFEGVDLPGMATDIESARKIAQAYRPVLDKRMRERHGIKLLATISYTAQVFFCREPVKQLTDLKGRKIRTRGRNMADYVSALGGSPVTLPFAEVVTALQTGVIDCAVTGIGSGNAAKWYEVANNLYNLPIDWSVGFYGIGMKRWQKLDPAVQALLEEQALVLEDRLWTETKRENEFALACNTGKGDCEIHDKANMQAAAPDAKEQEVLRGIAQNIAEQWGKRCGADCVKEWNETAGKAAGVSIH
ncbi:TRAP transporter substrate-binding protein [Allopusillimonas ginsengisoli]|uniref:TRAP transporter substrate-binding protein n=1 Tax=Allopusillimonas ginsengisoli TaxID=453575 RepID=UPI0010C18156|nr:C4-dicarboxylate ABC transporter [Allopusillimonas ginsengisoli]